MPQPSAKRGFRLPISSRADRSAPAAHRAHQPRSDEFALGYTIGMASPESSRSTAHPAWVAGSTPRAIHDALVEPERAEFVRRYGEEMSAAAQSLDLTGVLAVLATFRQIAETTLRHGPEAHTRMLDQVRDLRAGHTVVTTGAAEHRARIDAALDR